MNRGRTGLGTLLCLLSTALAEAQLQTSAVSGRILAPDGTPVAHAQVLLRDASGRTLAEAASDHEGRFHLRGVASGLYQLQAAGPGLRSPSQRLALRDAGFDPLTLGTVRVLSGYMPPEFDLRAGGRHPELAHLRERILGKQRSVHAPEDVLGHGPADHGGEVLARGTDQDSGDPAQDVQGVLGVPARRQEAARQGGAFRGAQGLDGRRHRRLAEALLQEANPRDEECALDLGHQDPSRDFVGVILRSAGPGKLCELGREGR